MDKGLTAEQREKVKEISMDMWEWFQVVAEERIAKCRNSPRQISFNQIFE